MTTIIAASCHHRSSRKMMVQQPSETWEGRQCFLLMRNNGVHHDYVRDVTAGEETRSVLLLSHASVWLFKYVLTAFLKIQDHLRILQRAAFFINCGLHEVSVILNDHLPTYFFSKGYSISFRILLKQMLSNRYK